MRVSILLSLALSAFAAAWATDAKDECSNPPSAQYLVTMTAKKNAGIDAQIVAQTGADGCAEFMVNINGKEFSEGGPFLYHIHQDPVPSDGNCTAALAHLDPYNRGEDPPCDSSQPESCQVGDLSGKHGKIPSLPGFSKNYTDKYVSLSIGNAAYLGNRSIVIHYANKTRIACANFKYVQPSNKTSSTHSPSLTTITSTLSSGSNSGSLTTITSTLGGGLGIGISIGNGGSSTTTSTTASPTVSTTTSTISSSSEGGGAAVKTAAVGIRYAGALVVGIAAVVA